MSMDFTSNKAVQDAILFVEQNIGEMRPEDLQEKLNQILADKLGLKADNKETFIKAISSERSQESKRKMAEKLSALQKLVRALTLTPAGEVQTAKDARALLSNREFQVQLVATFDEAKKYYMDIMQEVTYEMYLDGASGEEIYDVIIGGYAGNTEGAKDLIDFQLAQLGLKKEAMEKTEHDPLDEVVLDEMIATFEEAKARLLNDPDRGREIQVDHQVNTLAINADPKLVDRTTKLLFFQALMASPTPQDFEAKALSGRDNFPKEIAPIIGLVLHMASKEINQGQGKIERAQLLELMKLIKNCQGLLAAFQANKEGHRTVVSSYGREIIEPGLVQEKVAFFEGETQKNAEGAKAQKPETPARASEVETKKVA